MNITCREIALARTVGVICLLVLIAGCGDGRVSVYPVTGTVLYHGEPAADADVTFYDTRPPEQTRDIPIPQGRTDAQGQFKLTTFEENDGAPAGKYRVAVKIASITEQAVLEQLRSDGSGNQTGGLKYLSPETSGLTATVTEQATILEPFTLE